VQGRDVAVATFSTRGVRRPVLASVTAGAGVLFALASWTLLRVMYAGEAPWGWLLAVPRGLWPALMVVGALATLFLLIQFSVSIVNELGSGVLLRSTRLTAGGVRVEFSQGSDLTRRYSVIARVGDPVRVVIVRVRKPLRAASVDRIELKFPNAKLANRTFRLFADEDFADLEDFLSISGFEPSVLVTTETG